jgi:hypothetical protein
MSSRRAAFLAAKTAVCAGGAGTTDVFSTAPHAFRLAVARPGRTIPGRSGLRDPAWKEAVRYKGEVMSRWIPACLTAGLLLAPAVRAEEPVGPPKDLPPATSEAPPPLEAPVGCEAGRTISLPSYTLQEVQSATTLPRMKLRDEIVGVQCGGPVLDYIEQRQTITVIELTPRQTTQQVTCMTSEPVTTVDECGKCCTVYQQVPSVKDVTITVFEPKSVQKDVIVRVPVLKPGKDLQVRRLVLDQYTIPAVESRFNLLTVPNEVAVPEAPVCPTTCAPACPGK